MLKINLTQKNFLLFCMNNYKNPAVRTLQEFEDDTRKNMSNVVRGLVRYKKTGAIKVKEVLNSIVVLNNVYGVEATNFLLFFKTPKDCWAQLTTFLFFLDILIPTVNCIEGHVIDTNDFVLDVKLHKELKELVS